VKALRLLKSVQFYKGLPLRTTETEQYIKKGQVNWVQPFKQLSLEGLCIWIGQFFNLPRKDGCLLAKHLSITSKTQREIAALG
jgi:hypothetical protein